MKFSSLLTSAWLIALAQPTAAQINNDRGRIVGDGQLVTQQRTVGRFDQLSVDYAVTVRITEGDPALVELEAEGNVLPYLTVDTKGGQLLIGLSRRASFKEIKKVTVTIHNPRLNRISARTACGITSELPIEGKELILTLNEACSLTAPLRLRRLEINLEAASSVTLQGETTEATLRLEGAGKVNAEKLTIGQAEVSLNGASQARLHVTGTLTASADGVSTLTYSGNPTVQSAKTTGLSSIEPN